MQSKNCTTKEHENCKVSTITNNPIGGLARKYWISVGNTAMVVTRKSAVSTAVGAALLIPILPGNLQVWAALVISCCWSDFMLLNVGGNITGSGTALTNLNYNAITNKPDLTWYATNTNLNNLSTSSILSINNLIVIIHLYHL